MINLTDTAVAEVKRLMSQQSLERPVLRLGVTGGGCSGLQYTMNLDPQVGEGDQVFDYDGFKVACDAKSYLYLNGMSVDFTSDMLGGGFKFDNPNAAKSCGCGTSFRA